MKITFWNCGGTGNLGDDLCHLGAVERCYRMYHHFEAHKIFKLNHQTIKIVNSSDLLVIGGGRLLNSGSDFLESIIRYGVKVPYVFIGIGVGAYGDVEPYRGKIRARDWVVRNRRSAEILERCGFGPVSVEDDLSELVPIPFVARRADVGLNMRNEGKGQDFIEELRRGLPKDVVLVSFNTTARHRAVIDGAICDVSDCDDTALMSNIGGRETIGYRGGFNDPIHWASQLGRFSFMVVERFHAAVLAKRLGIPFYAINSGEKIERFMKENGLGDMLIPHQAGAIIEKVEEGLKLVDVVA
jgi:hypothetical protein